MGDAEGAAPSSKKRAARRQITQLDPEPDDNSPEPEMGFKRASDDVLAARRIVKVRRTQPTSAPSSNPFAGIRFGEKTNSTSVQPQNLDGSEVLEEQSAESSEGKGVIDSDSVTEPNGTEHTKILDVSEAKGGDKVENDAGSVAPQIAESGEVENGKKETEGEAQEETKEQNNPEGKSGEDTEAAVGEKPVNDNQNSEKKSVEETEAVVLKGTGEGEKQVKDQNITPQPAARVCSFQQLSSSQNAFTGISGTGFSTSGFSFGVKGDADPGFDKSPGPVFGFKSENTSYPSFGFGCATNGGSSSSIVFGTASAETNKNEVASNTPSMQEVPVETGEENEKVVFNADAVMYEYLDGGWKERGKGELKVNVSISGNEKARLVMRARGNYRLILNASLYPDMVLTNMEKRGITFACFNTAGEGKDGLKTFALKFKDNTIVGEFREVVTMHKGKKATELNTPENSPKASDD